VGDETHGAVHQTALPGLVLRELGTAYAEAFYALVQNNRAHLTAFGDFERETAAPLGKWIAEFATRPVEGRRFGIFLQERLIGRVDLVAVDPPKYSVGYWLAKEAVGRGYATAAIAALAALARDELGASDIYAGVTHGNIRSESLLERLGFVRVARFERYTRFHLPLCPQGEAH
jgi:RimJ/RimL family protein N-acetyltransferase